MKPSNYFPGNDPFGFRTYFDSYKRRNPDFLMGDSTDFQRYFKIYITKDILEKHELPFTEDEKESLMTMLNSDDESAQDLAFNVIKNKFILNTK